MTAKHLISASQLIAPWTGAVRMRDHLPLLRWAREIRSLFETASPIVLIGLLNMAMSIMDVAMLCRHDPEGLAAAVIISDLYSIFFNFSAGFANMVAPQVATALGAGFRWQVCGIVKRAMALVLSLGAIGTAIILLSPDILEAAGFHKVEPASDYASFMAGTYIFMVLFALARSVLSAMGRPGPALLAIVVALPIKAAANYAFIWGAWGAPCGRGCARERCSG